MAPPDIYARSDSFGQRMLADVNGDGRLDVLAASDLLLQRPSAATAGSAARRGLQQQLHLTWRTTPSTSR